LQAQALADDAKVRVQGVVTSLPGMFGTQIFYLQDDTAGIQIYKYDAVFPTLALGDEIQIEGTLSTIRGERRIKVSSASAIVVTGHDEARQPVELKAEELDASHVGSLVAAAGLIVERSGNDLTLEDNGAQTIIRLMDGTKLDPMRYAPGNHLRAVGVLSTSNGTLRVLPRDETDLVITEMPPPVPGEQTGKAQQTQQSQSTATTIVLVALAGLLALAARHYFPKLKAHYAKNLALRPAAQKPH
jgi:DNA/RNA endonuclease YhcR with UshA esterase domain